MFHEKGSGAATERSQVELDGGQPKRVARFAKMTEDVPRRREGESLKVVGSLQPWAEEQLQTAVLAKMCVDKGTSVKHTQYAHMNVKRAHVLLPEDLLREIDSLVGPRGRSSFLVETARQEVRRQKQLTFLESRNPVWKDKDHPELADGPAAWVRRLRAQSESRSESRSQSKNRARNQSSRAQTSPKR